ncbi:MAG: sigma-70 family RNA polymerase sigma factor [Pseudomonadota bacterium]|nr:sigma-70 family RNA polymerase sigma factor [Pseudomonadota bacterium]
MRNSQVKPWLNEDGSVKSDAELRKAGQEWSPSVWRQYLATLTVGRREEYVLSSHRVDTFSAEECAGLLFSMANEERHHLLKVALNACILALTPRQREVVTSHYWDGKTIAEIASNIGISKQSVSKTMKKALSEIKTHLTSGAIRKRVQIAQGLLAS